MEYEMLKLLIQSGETVVRNASIWVWVILMEFVNDVLINEGTWCHLSSQTKFLTQTYLW